MKVGFIITNAYPAMGRDIEANKNQIIIFVIIF